ncbi:MAG: hypothetical protein B7Y99_13005 [Caulobacterales bacterium 32-69-10]|nr:MAG: hypothetical protein B7Y99_13005 [Caulobacterales bacterium 32-69-10]
MSQGFAGMLLLGGITSLPEVATAGGAALTGAADLAVSNLLGTSSINVVLLVFADALLRGQSLDSTIRTPTPLIQAALCILLMNGVALVAVVGDREILSTGLGYGATGLLLACVASLWLISRYEKFPGWTTTEQGDGGDEGHGSGDEPERTTAGLAWRTAAAAAVILVAGFVLSQTGEAVARESGLGVGLVGLVLVGAATSLPELSSVAAAIRIKRYQLAIGDIFGTNIFNVGVLFIVDLAHRPVPALAEAGLFEATAATLAVGLTGLFMLGMLARRNTTWLGLGRSSWWILGGYGAGLVLLWAIDTGRLGG